MKKALITIIYLSLTSAAWASCPFRWSSTPQFVFNNIGEKCNLVISEKIADIPMPDGTSIPIQVDFDSSRTTSSEYLGNGWFFNLGDIMLVPTDTDSYAVLFPNRQKATLRRSGDNTYANYEWVLKSEKSKRELFRRCGTSLAFSRDGRIIRGKSTGGAVVVFKYENNKLSSIESNGAALALFSYDGDNIKIGVKGDSRKIELKVTRLGGKYKMLQSIAIDGETISEFAYKQPSGSRIHALEHKRKGSVSKFEWDAESGIVARETFINGTSKDSYSFKANHIGDNAYDITRRRDSDNYEELRANNLYTGIQKSWDTGGPFVTRYLLLGGAGHGNARKETITRDGKSSTAIYHYDHKGRMIRKIVDGKIASYIRYDDKNGSITHYDGKNQFVWRKTFDKTGKMVSYEKSGGDKVLFKHLPDGNFEATLVKDGKSVSHTFNSL